MVMPYSTCSRKTHATPSKSKDVTVGMAWICLESQSTTTRIASYPLDSGSPPMMSTDMTCHLQSGTLLGISFPTFHVGNGFNQLQALHPQMYLATYHGRPGHQ